MRLTLSSAALRHFAAAQRALLSPLAYPSSDAWRTDVARCVVPLLGADQAVFVLPRTTGGASLLWGIGYDIAGAGSSYAAHFGALDVGMQETRRIRGLEVYHRDQLYDRAQLGATEIYADWAVPHRFLDIVGMAFDPVPGAPFACLHLMHDRDHRAEDPERTGAFGARGRALLRLLLPAFKAGVRTHLALLEQQRTLAAVLDRIETPFAVYEAGREYRNRALVALLAAEPDRTRIEAALRAAADRLEQADGAPDANPSAPPAALVLATARGRYRLQPSYTSASPRSAAAVLVEDATNNARPSRDVLRAQWGLTRREADVLDWLYTGHSTRSLAAGLGISYHTARRHTERLLQKLGLHSRAAIAAAVQAADGQGGRPAGRLVTPARA